MSRLVLGVIGHVDHGKTALVHALTGMPTDRLPEEQARGISIALGFAHMTVGHSGDEADLIDMPGHERFVRTMVSGATGVDAVLLVADAREGVMPQTREHTDIAALLGVRRAVLAVSRIDLARPAQVAATARAAAALAAGAGLLAGPAIPTSARTGAGLDALRTAIAAELQATRPAEDDGFCTLPIDRTFSLPGHGTVVTGTLRHGTLAAGDTVEIAPSGTQARIRSLQVHRSRVALAHPGQRVAVNLRGVEPAQVPRGNVLCTPGALPPATWVCVQLTAVQSAPLLATTQPVRLLFGAKEVAARLRLLDREVLAPGETALAQLRCAAPVCLAARERFIIRLASPASTVAGGQVLDPQATRLRRHAPAVLDRLSALARADPAGIVAGEVERAGTAGISLARLARLAAQSSARTAALLPAQSAVLTRAGDVVGAAALAALAAVLPRVLAAYSDGVARETLQGLIPRAGRAALDEALARLLAAGTLAREGAAFRLRQPGDAAAAARAQAAASGLAAILRQAGLTPPDPAELAPDTARRRLLDTLVRQGVLVRAPDRVQKREMLFHRDTIEAARQHLSALLTGDGLLVGEIGAALGISRKFSVPLLEYLDSIHFTRRLEERRVLAAPR